MRQLEQNPLSLPACITKEQFIFHLDIKTSCPLPHVEMIEKMVEFRYLLI